MAQIAILGNGSRENAIREKLKDKNNVYICNDLNQIKNLNKVDLIVANMEKDLVDGSLETCGIPFFGPSKKASQIEGSKIFSKTFMKNNNIPTSNFNFFDNLEESKNFFINQFKKNKKVIKLDRLAFGKGVYVPETLEEGIQNLETIYENQLNEKIIIEDRLYGEEVSIMGFCNGKEISLMPQVKDYKRIYDNNIGLNTGGMGAIGPVNVVSKEILEEIKIHMTKIVKNLNFCGVLYGGLMISDKNYNFLEFNCRFGDPETQVLMNLLETDLYSIFISCINKQPLDIQWNDKFCANVVLSHEDYPKKKLEKETEIILSKEIDNDIKIYWANNVNNMTKGGRVCSVTHTSNDLYYSLTKVYNNIHKINFSGSYYRKDIGYDYLLDKYKLNKTKKLKLAVLSSSRGTSLEKLLKHNLIEIIISNKDTEVLKKGLENNIKTLYLPKIDYKILINILDCLKIDIIYLVGFLNIVPKYFCEYYKGKIFNIHPSLLPKYGNMYSMDIHDQVIKNKELFSGCTLHQVTENVDEGKIMLQKQILLNNEESNFLKNKIQNLEKNILYDFLFFFQNQIINYKNSGVDINKGNDFVSQIKNEDIGSFCSINKIGNTLIACSTDGVGTKLELAKEYNMYEGIGIDLVAMCVNDLYARGATPKLFLDYIATNTINPEFLVKIINSIKDGCKISNIKLVGGETAEMPGLYKYKDFDLAGFSVGEIDSTIYPITEKIKKGQKIYALKSNGIHSNGFSMVRKLLKSYEYDYKILLKPTKIYTECLTIKEKFKDNLLAMAHITGGGLIENIKRVIPKEINIKFNIKIENEFLWIMEKSKISFEEMLSTFNCGYGMAFIFNKEITYPELVEIGYLT